VEPMDRLEYAPTGTLSIFRDGRLVATRVITPMAIRSWTRIGWIEAA
jgi:hypothetical protein